MSAHTTIETPPESLVDAARARVAAFSAQLRSGVDGAAQVPNLDWNVAELAQHVACLPDFWNTQHGGGERFDRPEDFGAFSDAARAHITESTPVALADLIDAEFAAFIDDLAAATEPRWLYGAATTARNMLGLVINETMQHGMDLAAVTGADVAPFTRDEANAAVDAMMVTTPAFIDADKANAQPDGVYAVRFVGGADYTWTKAGPTLTITAGRPSRADAHMRADPAMFLLASLGRVSQVRAALSGKMITWGRRPWRFLGLAKMAVDGV